MGRLTQLKKCIFWIKIFLLLITTLGAQAQQAATENLVAVATGFYHVDTKNHLIVINQAIKSGQQDITGLQLDQPYQLTRAVASLEVGQRYQLERQGEQYTVYVTQLPVVEITTRYPIVDAPSVYASFKLTEASGTSVSASVGIEVRGGSSQDRPKKSYELSFWNDTLGTTSRDVQLLGMRTDNGWNLLALFNEQLRTNNKVSSELWQEIHQPYYLAKEPDAKSGVATAYVEVFLNGSYRGFYLLTEKVDRKQLKLKKYSNAIKGELYKGTNWDEGVVYSSAPAIDNTSTYWSGFEYKYPDERIDWTNLHDFVQFVTTSSDADFRSQYAKRFRVDNAVDYYIFLNLLRAVDNTGKNLYVAKYTTGEPYFFVPWDLDATFGYDWQGLNDNTTTGLLTNGFYRRLNDDCSAAGFREALAKRWATLRTTLLTQDRIMAKFRTQAEYLRTNGAFEREHLAWSSYTYNDAQLDYVASWLRARLTYLDAAFSQPCAATALAAAPAAAATGIAVYPNPAHDQLTVELPSGTATGEATIRDLSGRLVLHATLGARSAQLPLGSLAPGLYLVSISTPAGTRVTKLAVE